MSHPSPADSGRTASPSHLQALADLLVDVDDADDRCLVVGIEPDDDEVQLHVRAVPDPLDALVGLTAPTSWSALGVVAHGRAHRGGSTQPCRLAHVLDRAGASVTTLLRTDGARDHLDSDDAVPGLTADACRRALGLSTAPPEVPPTAVLPFLWLDAIVAAAVARPGLDEHDLWLLHPALPLVPADDDRPLPARCTDAAALVSWSWLRTACAAGEGTGAVPPAIATWCDDGAFARLLLVSLPPVHDLCDALRSLVPSGIAHRVLATIERASR